MIVDKHDMDQNKLLGVSFLILNIFVSAGAQFLLKYGMLQVGSFSSSENVLRYISKVLSIEVIGGLFFYGVGMILWLLTLSKLDLSFAYPTSTLQYILIFFGSWYLFHETISAMRITGTIIILLGILILSLDFRKP